MSESADVYRMAERVGWISRTQRGSVFEFDERFFERHLGEDGGIALHLPYARRSTETAGVNLHTYFAGLLPEGLRLKALVRNTKTSEDDLLGLLIAAGSDCIGDISVTPAGQPLSPSTPSADLARLDEVAFSELFRQSVAQEGRVPEPSIPGVQEKVSAAMMSFPISGPVSGKKDGHPSILKLNPEDPDKPLLVQNEEFFLKMAKACGLEVPGFRLVRDKTGAYGLLVERFDRMQDPASEAWIGIHQEDACQFLDRYPADKYRLSCSEIARGLSVCSAPVVEIARFVRLTAFSYLIGNGDLHAKNVSIRVLPKTGRVEMTPSYDVLSTIPYGDQKMALKLDGRDDNITREMLTGFAARFGVKEAAMRSMLDEIVDASAPWIGRLGEIGLGDRKTSHLERVMLKRREELS